MWYVIWEGEGGDALLLSLATQDVIQPQQLPLSVPYFHDLSESVMMKRVSFSHCESSGLFLAGFTPTVAGTEALESLQVLCGWMGRRLLLSCAKCCLYKLSHTSVHIITWSRIKHHSTARPWRKLLKTNKFIKPMLSWPFLQGSALLWGVFWIYQKMTARAQRIFCHCTRSLALLSHPGQTATEATACVSYPSLRNKGNKVHFPSSWFHIFSMLAFIQFVSI